MKILHLVTKDLSRLNGISVYVYNLIKSLHNYDVKNIILSFDEENGTQSPCLNLIDTPIIQFKNQVKLFAKNPINNLFPRFKKLMQNYDLIHIHSYIFLTTIQALWFCKKNQIPSILTLHGGVQTKIGKNLPLKDKILLNFKKYVIDKTIGNWIIRNADHLVSVSKKDIQSIGNVFNVNRNHNYYIPNGVNLENFSFSKTTERKCITFIGRLDYIKGFDIFLKIIKKIRQLGYNDKILVIGLNYSNHLIKELRSISNLEYRACIPYENMQEIYHRTKILLVTSRFEGLPTTILEAMASGAAILSSRVGGIPELINDGENGYLFDPHNFTQALNLLIKLLENKNLRFKFAKRSYNKIEQKYTWNEISKQYFSLYSRILKKK